MFNSKSKIFRYFLLCFVIGVGLASFSDFDYFFVYLLILIFGVSGLIFWPHKFWRWLFLGGAIIGLGIFRYQLSLPKTDETKIWFYNNQRLTFQGLVIGEPDVRINHTKLTVAANGPVVNGERRAVEGKVLINVSLYPEYQYGDLVEVNCQLKPPEPFNGFAYDRYLAINDVYSQCSYPRVKLISRGNADWLLGQIFGFKNKLNAIINYNLPEPQASLFSAIILGSRRGIPQELSDQFNITGTSHLVAISGLNITIITAILMQLGLAFYLPRQKVFWFVTAALILYMILIGFPASAVRAAIMGWLVILAMYLGRLNRSTNALIFAASLMILINPKILRDDVGFQLSFCAVLGLIYLSPLFEKWLEKIPSALGLRESLQMTLAAQISTLPLIVYNFGRLSLIGPVANLLVLPTSSYLMAAGLLAIFLSLLAPVIAQYLFWPVWLILTYLIKVVEFLALVPLAALNF